MLAKSVSLSAANSGNPGRGAQGYSNLLRLLLIYGFGFRGRGAASVNDALGAAVATADYFGIAFLAFIDDVERIGSDALGIEFLADFGFEIVAGFASGCG
jgi:hypothetical protein